MQLTQRRLGSTLVLAIEETRLDSINSGQLLDLMKASASDAPADIAIDLTAVSFIDSTGLGAIVAARKAVHAGHSFCLFGLQDPIRAVFTLTRLDRVMPVYATEEEFRASAAA